MRFPLQVGKKNEVEKRELQEFNNYNDLCLKFNKSSKFLFDQSRFCCAFKLWDGTNVSAIKPEKKKKKKRIDS